MDHTVIMILVMVTRLVHLLASGATINLANTILGTGMLAMPGALAAVGMILGSFMIVFSAFASGLGLYFLTRSASRTEGRSASFFACSKLTYPWAAVIFDFAIAIKCFGVGISYLIIIGDLMPEVVKSMSTLAFVAAGGDGSGDMDPILWFLIDRRFWITIFMGIIGPLSFLKKLDSLKATSALALVAVVYLVFIVIYYYVNPEGPLPPKEDIQYFKFSGQFFTTLPIFVFAFTCHQNIFSCYNELTDNGQSMLNRIITSSIGAAVGVYHVIGVLGYLTFGNAVGSNIIQMYNSSMLVTIGRIAIVVLVMFSFPLQCHPCRACLDKVLFAFGEYWQTTRFGKAKKYNSLNSHDADEDHASNTATLIGAHQHDDHGGVIPEPSQLKYIVMTSAIILGSYIVAITVSELELVLSLVGSTGSTAISFILPGSFYYKLHVNDPWTVRKMLSVGLLTYGWLVMIICLSANIRRIISG
ncbi:transmembrane amino acid transporter protein-domain-containing protein [Lobosporangium transversale]|uniref:Transmembrane amino acid transporter protein-domain-containing protein n=1 Tax=Lobosporangium transversale TaxID=64571 RepID=A0A1Y2G1L7_9FUNG|nr:transmembrane amino acid transporter protein-domain-containing protein [Lobosporangium transversale]ORY90048.1 transmembrane amino acid transporter protein-domain-containing protein [Lobosporangium transversale]|eukprot:XP_021875084.1 transmembrane amino acid transporter protein-domain-containing protein [Lobosporangium transversale]